MGLGYLGLGHPLSTVSGGKGQRLKLAAEVHEKGSVYVMDEPPPASTSRTSAC